MSGEEYNPFPDVSFAVSYYTQRLAASFPLLQQSQSGFDEVDTKRFEARQCVVFELGISAIVMSCVALEECLKTLLKYHHFCQQATGTTDVTLEDWERTSRGAEDAYGTFSLHNAIQKARKENLITESEEEELLHIKEFVRNAFVHSDKSKIFDPKPAVAVSLLALGQGAPQVTDERMMSLLDLNIAQGIAQKKLANQECRRIHQAVDGAILRICERFWRSHRASCARDGDGA